jgi:ketosteroid isomerase-like protein
VRSDVEANATVTEETLNRFFDAWNAHDVDAIMSFFAGDCAYLASFGPERDGSAFRGADEVRRGVTAFLTTFQDAHYTDLRLFVAGDRGAAEWTFSGMRDTGERVTYRGCDLFEFDGARIRLKDAFRKERSRPLAGMAPAGSEPAV